MIPFAAFLSLLGAVGFVAGAYRLFSDWTSEVLLHRTMRKDERKIKRLLLQEQLRRHHRHANWSSGMGNGALMSEESSRAVAGSMSELHSIVQRKQLFANRGAANITSATTGHH
jgi:hypothetical protein